MENQIKFTIAGLGEILWDVYGSQKLLGGAPANFALHVQKLGHSGLVFSKVGDDHDGKAILNTLENQGLDTRFIQVDKNKPTGTVKVELDEKGKPSFDCTKDVAFDYLQNYSDHDQLVPKLDAVLFGTLAQRNSASRNSIQKFIKNKSADLIVFDANLRGVDEKTKEIVRFSLTHSDILKLNDTEAELLPKLLDVKFENELDFFQYVLKQYQLKLICLTLGEKGALAVSPDEVVYSPGFEVTVVDTTGSGDAFMAALLVSFLEQRSLKDCFEFANVLGAFVATQKGAVPNYRLNQLDQIKNKSSDRIIDSNYKNHL